MRVRGDRWRVGSCAQTTSSGTYEIDAGPNPGQCDTERDPVRSPLLEK